MGVRVRREGIYGVINRLSHQEHWVILNNGEWQQQKFVSERTVRLYVVEMVRRGKEAGKQVRT